MGKLARMLCLLLAACKPMKGSSKEGGIWCVELYSGGKVVRQWDKVTLGFIESGWVRFNDIKGDFVALSGTAVYYRGKCRVDIASNER